MKLLIAGGSGFIGKELTKELINQGHEIILLTRNPSKSKDLNTEKLRAVEWNGKDMGNWSKHVNEVDGIINLCGESIAEKWTKEYKERLLSSRLNSTKAIINSIEAAKVKPKVLINASAVGYYGNVENDEVTEDYKKGTGFLPELCSKWEDAASEASVYGVRVVKLRIGIVLEKNGGALLKMIPPFLIFAGGPLGSGKQWFPWIHRDDVVKSIIFCLENQNLSGPVNITAPEVITMKNFCSSLGKTLNRPSWAPVPGFVLKIILGEMAGMLLTGQKAIPKKLEEFNYKFKFRNIDAALKDILKK